MTKSSKATAICMQECTTSTDYSVRVGIASFRNTETADTPEKGKTVSHLSKRDVYLHTSQGIVPSIIFVDTFTEFRLTTESVLEITERKKVSYNRTLRAGNGPSQDWLYGVLSSMARGHVTPSIAKDLLRAPSIRKQVAKALKEARTYKGLC